ncbi:hypothetical protein IMZ31_19490 (plasmid) [Pontibacillus sp. ALD_SL1]|uniref:hypothetical protein n=1 Tax=Pontibacillus sp. ALD_SL1 TaxID=2777185 RepID=UPI001A963139|nr:hypothetical protein [Pontibacillus sp. ALD_SL1]QST02735.1 hypothetical protein IMZ31_19490 [Pontibacillus sp. ALD_SL1]
MNILITSGSTREMIDPSHYMSGLFGGSIGALLGEECSMKSEVEQIFFVHSRDARYPFESTSMDDSPFSMDHWKEKVTLYPADTIEDLEHQITSILENHVVDVVVHLMSIHNYGKSNLHFIDNAQDAEDFIHYISGIYGIDINILPAHRPIYKEMESGFNHLFIEQTPTPKLMDLFREHPSSPMIISSKMNVSKNPQDVLKKAKRSLAKNNTDFVIALDHYAYQENYNEIVHLVHPGDEIETFDRYEKASKRVVSLIKERFSDRRKETDV